MTVGSILRHAATRWPEGEALVTDSRRLTYRDLFESTNRFAHGLRGLGVERGDAVGIVASNSVEQVVSYLAIQTVGAVAVPVNPRLSVSELAAILDDAEATTVVCDAERTPTVHRAASEAAAVSRCISTDPVDEMQSFDSVMAGESTNPPDVEVGLDEPGVMMHTSGTTGQPKLVVLTHGGQVLNSMACAIEFGFGSDDRALHVAPLYHSAGYLNLLLPCLQTGATHVLQSEFDPEQTLQRIEAESATVSLGVPTHYQLLRQVDPEPFDVSSLRALVTSGAPVAQATVDWVERHLCETFVNAYGMTETCGLVTTSWDVGSTDGAYRVGEPFLGVDVRLVAVGENVEPDRTVAPGERGQLVVRSPKLMDCYYGRPGKTDETVRDGWLYTGDVAVERDGDYYLVDRMDNRIISGGENIYPQEVERILADHPDVVDCAVVGASDPTFGERVVAYVVADGPMSLADVDDFWENRTDAAGFKRPRELRLTGSIPRNDSGKILRDELGVDATQ